MEVRLAIRAEDLVSVRFDTPGITYHNWAIGMQVIALDVKLLGSGQWRDTTNQIASNAQTAEESESSDGHHFFRLDEYGNKTCIPPIPPPLTRLVLRDQLRARQSHVWATMDQFLASLDPSKASLLIKLSSEVEMSVHQ